MLFRSELNESLSNLTRLIVRGIPAYYAWHPRLKETLMELILTRLRNLRTGWRRHSVPTNASLRYWLTACSGTRKERPTRIASSSPE